MAEDRPTTNFTDDYERMKWDARVQNAKDLVRRLTAPVARPRTRAARRQLMIKAQRDMLEWQRQYLNTLPMLAPLVAAALQQIDAEIAAAEAS